MGYEQEIWYLRSRVKELEKQIDHLRISRRVLMNLIEKIEREKRNALSQLEKENKRLQHNNIRYAQWLMKNNNRLVEMQMQGYVEQDQTPVTAVED